MNEEIIRQNWAGIKDHIRTEYKLSNISYKTWIEGLTIARIEGNTVTIEIPSEKPFMLTYIENNYKILFKITITEMLNENYEIEFVLKGQSGAAPDPVPEPVSSYNNVRYESAGLNPKYRFDTFVVGKTHLMHSIGHYILEKQPDKKILYVTSEQFTNEVIESIRSGNANSMVKFRDKYRTVDVLLIDDIQFIIGKESTQEEFFHTFNQLHAAGKQIVLSSDRPPREMETLDERFRSRFEWGLIADIQAPDYETRMAILRKNADLTGRRLDDAVLEYIATNIKSNIRELEGAFNKIIAYSRLNNVDANLENAKEALRDIIYPDKSNILTPEMIANTVCEHYGVRLSSIASRKKNAENVVPRQVIMYLCREHTDATLDSVAKLLNKKDHSTVMHGVDKIREELKVNPELRANVEIIQKKLNIPV